MQRSRVNSRFARAVAAVALSRGTFAVNSARISTADQSQPASSVPKMAPDNVLRSVRSGI